MYTIILCCCLAFILSIVFTYKNGWRIDDIDMFILNSFCGSLFGLVIGVIIWLLLPMKLKTETYSANIVTLQDNSTTSGHFFLGSGVIEGRMMYVFYYETNGGYKMAQVDYKDVIIRYTNGSPRIITSELVATNDWINKWATDGKEGDKTYVIEVPKGTIQNNYTLDAK